jgi:TATA-box binding protein (TBP) (component of TFIID and TFIIIB)
MTNLTLDIRKLHQHLPITEYIVVPKRRGRKKKNAAADPNKDIPSGSIITVDFENKVRGVRLKKKKKSAAKKGEDYFRNSVTVVMVMGKKNINFKVSRNGKFQMTGCKTDEHAENCIKYIWRYIKDSTGIYEMTGDTFTSMFIPAMRNIDFALGFEIDREKLDQYFNLETDYNSLLETSIGYTGVNIKIPFKKPITNLCLKRLVWDEDANDWDDDAEYVGFDEYLALLKPKDREKKLKKERYHTFLVFHSGKIIMSSLCKEFARDTYYEFMHIIRDNCSLFQEKLDI